MMIVRKRRGEWVRTVGECEEGGGGIGKIYLTVW